MPPLPASSSMSSEIGLPLLLIVPAMCTDAAFEAAVFVASRISAGDFDSMPLPEEDEEDPQPARISPMASRARAAAIAGRRREGIGELYPAAQSPLADCRPRPSAAFLIGMPPARPALARRIPHVASATRGGGLRTSGRDRREEDGEARRAEDGRPALRPPRGTPMAGRRRSGSLARGAPSGRRRHPGGGEG